MSEWRFVVPGQPPSVNHMYQLIRLRKRDGSTYQRLGKIQKVENYQRLVQLMAQQAKRKDGRIVIPRRIKSGAVLVRVWKDQSHRVMVLEDGFAYGGKTYASLSEIARLITGARWNGPRFFGLRSDNRESEK